MGHSNCDLLWTSLGQHDIY